MCIYIYIHIYIYIYIYTPSLAARVASQLDAMVPTPRTFSCASQDPSVISRKVSFAVLTPFISSAPPSVAARVAPQLDAMVPGARLPFNPKATQLASL